ncbi:hypothetical protein SAMN06297280_0468 [Arsukibacterium tuosuense]|uniref:Uncharacterized protein n=1 Tax=Arsukibacterium tuosuense TaxID=1323745 RepID=A0A285I3U3_9GAMM|nr:hypothetical protein [Arsukibacterium tuosuense]SNY42630.1 hypothetical protein SAMN06297280_0468 [Arsukibacterium tuosuense]
MKYSKWLTETYPQLENVSDVRVQNYIKQAKDDTKKVRFVLGIFTLVLSALMGYAIGYLIARYSSFGMVERFAAILLYALLIGFLPQKFEQRLVKNRITQVVAS